jgi:hypothetical protein
MKSIKLFLRQSSTDQSKSMRERLSYVAGRARSINVSLVSGGQDMAVIFIYTKASMVRSRLVLTLKVFLNLDDLVPFQPAEPGWSEQSL